MLLLLAAALVSSVELTQVTVDISHQPLPEVVSWVQWKDHFNMKFEKKLVELQRFSVFQKNIDKILQHNAEGHNWRMGVNQFTHLSEDEWAARFSNITFKHKPAPEGPTKLEVSAPLASVDWRKTAVTDVKNQGSCGSCWAFSTTGSVEGAWAIKHGELVSLSEEQLVQCDTKHDQGCQGGLMDYAFEYINGAGGITDEADYPYTSGSGVRGRCPNSIPQFVATVSSYKDVSPDNALQLQAALALGPVSIAVEADKSAWQSYRSGVMDSESCGTQLDHGVLAVGYNTAENYWIVKNSWGTSWGESGYIRLGISSSSSHGICGLLQQPSYPIVGDNPGPGPSPGPTPGPSGDSYEDPATTGSCADNEVAVQIQGIAGDFCSPMCDSHGDCPDAPAGVASGVTGSCALQTSSGDKYCALTCQPSYIGSKSCGLAECTCKRAQMGVGLCTYDD